jgi:uncharacterized protein YjbI with pentapeptide repeats
MADTHTALWDWGDGHTTPGTVTQSQGSGTVTAAHSFTTLGSHTVTLTVTDNGGHSGSSQTIIGVAPAGGFSGANLKDTDYTGANLSNQNLSGSNLKEAVFNHTNLQNSDLSRVNANKVSFQQADLTDANLAGGNFKDANFTGANLTGANLTGANLHGANVTDVIWNSTICPDGTGSDSSGTCVGHGGGL